ncbi:hypothetical protein KIMC2_03260 [Xylocopilactobacillus apis]|uniref:Uncharacterized protein n=1 Tax=Xylocopilactobacillus apis TaxID=2932183 RepID=A0AAU9CWN2_9LACO|nr:hypothetical protein KIMC2_03260 [Xylocopilactobacillus apis]
MIIDKVYFCWAFTIDAIKSIMDKDRKTGESAEGIFFWACDVIILDQIDVQQKVHFLIKLILKI